MIETNNFSEDRKMTKKNTKGWKILAHDYRPPVQHGGPLFDGQVPFTTPAVECDPDTSKDCSYGWNFARTMADAFMVAGTWPHGRPATVFEVKTNTYVDAGEKLRSPQLTFVRRATDEEIRASIDDLSKPFGKHRELMADEQWKWFEALGRPRHDEATVEDELQRALETRDLDWTLRRFRTTRDVRAALNTRAAKEGVNLYVAKGNAWDAFTIGVDSLAREILADGADSSVFDAMDAWAPGAAWDAKAADSALRVQYVSHLGWIQCDPDLLTVGLRDAFYAGLGIALQTGPRELGWAMLSR